MVKLEKYQYFSAGKKVPYLELWHTEYKYCQEIFCYKAVLKSVRFKFIVQERLLSVSGKTMCTLLIKLLVN